jgi:hypothetical protein
VVLFIGSVVALDIGRRTHLVSEELWGEVCFGWSFTHGLWSPCWGLGVAMVLEGLEVLITGNCIRRQAGGYARSLHVSWHGVKMY